MTKALYDLAPPKGHEDRAGELNPMRRGGEPVGIARAIAVLASEEACYINGHALVADGGLSSSHPFPQPGQLGKTTF